MNDSLSSLCDRIEDGLNKKFPYVCSDQTFENLRKGCSILDIQKWKRLNKSEKASHSDTEIIFGEKDGAAIALKIWPFLSDFAISKGLLKEIEIYQKVTELFNQHWTPNVVRFSDTAVCKGTELEKFGIFTPYYVAVLATEKIEGLSLDYALQHHMLDEDHLISIIFQVVHSIGTLSLAGVRHADLHLNNIMLTHGAQTTNYKADINGLRYWSVPTNPIAKIYDWDFGDLEEHCSRNRKTKQYAKLFDSRGTNPKADLYTFLSQIWMYVQNRPLGTLIESWISLVLLEAGKPSGLFEERGGFNFRLCKGPIADSCPAQVTKELCSGAWIPPDCLMKTPGQILSDPTFNAWSSAPDEAWGSDLPMA